jgi:glucose/arabinose dehydrogenase
MIPRQFPAALYVCLAAVVATSSCGGGSKDGGGTVDRSTRIGWDQRARDLTELSALHFVIYVDGTRNELADAVCTAPAGSSGFPCTASLPPMSAGQHSLELASYVFLGGEVAESARSAPLVVTATGSTGVTAGSVTLAEDAPAVSVPAPGTVRELTASDGTRLQVRSIVETERPSALALAADGSMFVADRGGRIRLIRDGVVAGESNVFEGGEPAGASVLDLALDPQFARTRFVFAIEAVGADPSTFRVSRFREAGGRLGERAVVLGGVTAAPDRPAASLAFGPDGLLYIAFDDGGDPTSAARAASYNGKVLRLNADGTTPADRAGASPVFVSNLRSPRSLDWDPASSSLWIADAGAKYAARIRQTARRGPAVTAVRLPLANGPSSVALYRGDLIPTLNGSLLAAPVDDATYLVRASLADASPSGVRSSERLVVSESASVRLVKVGPDGAIYVATDQDVLRIAPR